MKISLDPLARPEYPRSQSDKSEKGTKKIPKEVIQANDLLSNVLLEIAYKSSVKYQSQSIAAERIFSFAG